MDKMTEQMAIETHIEECKNRIDRIKEFMESNSDANTSECCLNIRVLEKSFKALEEIQQYRAIGTVKEIKIREAQFARLSEGYLSDLTLLREYQSIGTVEELQALKEKSVAKKPITREIPKTSWTREINQYICPSCNMVISFGGSRNCSCCGQHLDWE